MAAPQSRMTSDENSIMKQKPERFDDLDRRPVINVIQEHYGVKLQKVGSRRKWLRDASGRNWWVLGGLETWHGIPEEMMEHEKCSVVEGLLVIAYKKRTKIEVFKGQLGPLVSTRDELPRSAQQFHFDVEVSGTRMRCIQAPDVVLDRLATIPYSAKDRERDRTLNEFQKSVSAMSREEMTALMGKLNRIGDATHPVR